VRIPSVNTRVSPAVIQVAMVQTVMVWAAMVSTAIDGARAADAPPTPLLVEVEQGDGTVTAGRLERIDAAGVRLADVGGGGLMVPSERVRAVRRTSGQAEGGENALPRSRLRVTLIDGSTLAADDFAWQGEQPAVLMRPEGRIELPAGRVRSIAWLPETAAVDAAVPWQGAIPDGTEKDLVVVGTAENHEFVECAIAGVSADTITVVLEEETIPVKRSKVIGLQWLRDEAAAGSVGRALVSVPGGGVRASRVEWSADAFVIDGEMRLPAAMFVGIDYAAGRIVRLASLTAEKVDVEPWFGGLVPRGGKPAERAVGLAAFFAPRTIESAAGQSRNVKPDGTLADAGAVVPAIIMRPRTIAVWRLPPDSRRFRAVVDAVAGRQAADATVVAVAVDDRELFRQQVGATGTAVENAVGSGAGGGVPIDVDLTNGRRITVTVDFGSGGGIGGAVRFTNPVIER
jgi:hypothetical protein